MVSSYNSSEEMSQSYSSRPEQYLHKTSASKIYKKPQQGSSLAPAGAGSRPQPKVYKVKPIHFRELVQQLTGAPAGLIHKQSHAHPQTQAQARRSSLQSIAPPALALHSQSNQVQVQSADMGVVKQEPSAQEKPMFGGFDSTTELTLSPNFQAWFSFAMLSPGPAMEQRAVV